MSKRAKMLMESDDFTCVPLLIGCGQHETAAEFLLKHNDLDNAFAVVQVCGLCILARFCLEAFAIRASCALLLVSLSYWCLSPVGVSLLGVS